MYRILLADDHELVRDGILAILGKAHPDWTVKAVADGAQLLEEAESFRPHLVILDLSMPELDGLEAAARLRRITPEARILVLTVYSSKQVRNRVKRAGAHALVDKTEAPGRLVHAVEKVLAGSGFFSSNSAFVDLTELLNREEAPARFVLSRREIEIVRHLALGKRNKEIAAELDLSVRTVESHRARIMERLSVDSLADLVALAVREGIVSKTASEPDND